MTVVQVVRNRWRSPGFRSQTARTTDQLHHWTRYVLETEALPLVPRFWAREIEFDCGLLLLTVSDPASGVNVREVSTCVRRGRPATAVMERGAICISLGRFRLYFPVSGSHLCF
jgi:hypothetical protein